mmetsp:Transcript_12126/g.31078  ORF Transcript_12126/g.31078 Transcript_12126/m.31078 type:complete len:489 (+) Transcript_12126:192-1658(+)
MALHEHAPDGLGKVHPFKSKPNKTDCIKPEKGGVSHDQSDTSSDNTSHDVTVPDLKEVQNPRLGPGRPRKKTPTASRVAGAGNANSSAKRSREVASQISDGVQPISSSDGLLILHEAASVVLSDAIDAWCAKQVATPRKLARTASSPAEGAAASNPSLGAGLARTGSSNFKSALERTGFGQPAGRRRGRSELHGPCDHCGVQESPQWRKGPKCKPILCNACGTRFLRTRNLGKQSQIKAAAALAASQQSESKSVGSIDGATGEPSASDCSLERVDTRTDCRDSLGSGHLRADQDSPAQRRVQRAFGSPARTGSGTPTKSVTFKLSSLATHDEPEASHFSLENSLRHSLADTTTAADHAGDWTHRQAACQGASSSRTAPDKAWLGEAARTLLNSASERQSEQDIQPSFSVASACAAAGLMPLLSQVVPPGAPTHLQAFLRQQAGMPPAAALQGRKQPSSGNKAYIEAAQWRLRMVLAQQQRQADARQGR